MDSYDLDRVGTFRNIMERKISFLYKESNLDFLVILSVA
jgi:hypothetical protein